MIRELKAYDTNPSFVSSNKSPKTLPKNIHEKREFLESHVPLAHRPQIVVFNKIDIAGDKRVNYFKKKFRNQGIKVVKLSAMTKENQSELINTLFNQLENTN